MERKRALTIPFSLDKDKLTENPLRIPTSYLDCGKFEEQVSWTAIAGHKSRRRDSRHKNGAVLFDHNHAAMVRLGLAVRKPRLILTDVLKTDVGKSHLEKIKRRLNGKERRSRGKDLPMVSSDRPSRQTKSPHSKSKSESPQIKRTPQSSRVRLSRSAKKAQLDKKEDDKADNNDKVSGENGTEASGENGREASGEDGTEASGEDGTEASGEDGTEASGVDGTAVSAEDGTEASGVNGTEASGEDGMEASAEDGTEASAEDGTEASGVNGTEASGEDGTEASAEDGMEASGVNGTEASGEDGTEASGEDGTEASGEDGTEASGEDGTEASGEDRMEASGEDRMEASGEDGTEASGEDWTEASGVNGTEASGENGTEESGENGTDKLVDCGLSVSLEEDKTSETMKEPKKTMQQKRKLSDSDLESTESDSPKRPRASVLRLSGAVGMEGEPTSSEEKETDNKDSKNTDSGIVQFTVGDDANAEPTAPVPQEKDSATAAAEPIVLSSEDEDGEEKTDSLKPILQNSMPFQKKPEDILDIQMFHLLVNDNSHSANDTCLCLTFTNLYCGPYQAKANGDLLITDENIIIPLKDNNDEMDLMLTLERKQLKRYSVWEKHEMEDLKCFSGGNKAATPAVGLLFCVSEPAAEGVQYDLIELCGRPDSLMRPGKPSPFILIFLQDCLEGMEGAFLRSLLDMDCLNYLTQQKGSGEYDQAIAGTILSFEDSCELIKSSGLDPHLLRFLLLESDSPSTGVGHKRASSHDPGIETTKKMFLESEQKPEEAEQPKENKKTVIEPTFTLCHQRLDDSYSVTMCKADSSWVKYKHQGQTRRLIQFPPPPMKGGITVTMEDLQCLDFGQYLNDVIIDFYLKYLLQNALESVAQRSHIFSSFFYKQLTRRDNASEGGNSESCQRQKRYQRVRTWTRHVDIFSKDFIFVPVNQEAHWYLVVICFPGLEEPKTESLSQDQDDMQGSEGSADNEDKQSETTDTDLSNAKKEEEAPKDPVPGVVDCTEQTCQKKTICKRPCILVMDSLKRAAHERVLKLMREYLQSEWEARRGSSREFGPEQVESSNCQVPLQDNSSDCGLYLLHYVEMFLKDPIVHFDLPLQLKFWFPRHQVKRKREDIRDLVLKLYRIQKTDITR